MPDEDTPVEGGLEPALVDDASETTDAPEEAVEAPTFGVDDIAEGLGSRFQERFLAHHEPGEAIAKYGESVEHLQSAYGRLSQGGEPTQEDLNAAEALGIELPQQQDEPEEEVIPLWGAPWAEPTNYEDFVKLATERPDKCMAFIDKQPEGVIDAETRDQVLAYWLDNDKRGATAYIAQHARQQALDEARAYTDQRFQEYQEQMTPLQQRDAANAARAMEANIDTLAVRAKTEIPDFEEHQDGVMRLLQERADYDPTYINRLLDQPLEVQLQEISDLTGAAAWRNRPLAEAEAQSQAEAAEQAKVTSGSERGAGSAGSPGGQAQQSAMKKKHLADIKAALESPA